MDQRQKVGFKSNMQITGLDHKTTKKLLKQWKEDQHLMLIEICPEKDSALVTTDGILSDS